MPSEAVGGRTIDYLSNAPGQLQVNRAVAQERRSADHLASELRAEMAAGQRGLSGELARQAERLVRIEHRLAVADDNLCEATDEATSSSRALAAEIEQLQAAAGRTEAAQLEQHGAINNCLELLASTATVDALDGLDAKVAAELTQQQNHLIETWELAAKASEAGGLAVKLDADVQVGWIVLVLLA